MAKFPWLQRRTEISIQVKVNIIKEALVARHPDNLTNDMDLVPKEEVLARYQTRFDRWIISVHSGCNVGP